MIDSYFYKNQIYRNADDENLNRIEMRAGREGDEPIA